MRCHYTKRYDAAATALQAKPGLEKARQVIVSMFGDKADGQLLNEFGKDQRRLMDECGDSGEAQRHETRNSKAPSTPHSMHRHCNRHELQTNSATCKVATASTATTTGDGEGGIPGISRFKSVKKSTKTTKTLPFASYIVVHTRDATLAPLLRYHVIRDGVSSSYHTGVVVCDHAPEDHRHHHNELQHRGQSYDTGTRRQYESRSKLTLPSCRVDLRSKLRNSSSVRTITLLTQPHTPGYEKIGVFG